MVESGSNQVDPASALHHVTGETNFIQVFPSTQQVLPTFHLADVPIEANVSPKIKTKIWAHEFRKAESHTSYHRVDVGFSDFRWGIYAKFPLDAPALMKYSEVVCDLAARRVDWCFYDTQFCLLRQSNPVEFPWGSTHWELCIRAQNFNNACFSKAQARNNSSPGRPLVTKGFCRKFHRVMDC